MVGHHQHANVNDEDIQTGKISFFILDIFSGFPLFPKKQFWQCGELYRPELIWSRSWGILLSSLVVEISSQKCAPTGPTGAHCSRCCSMYQGSILMVNTSVSLHHWSSSSLVAGHHSFISHHQNTTHHNPVMSVIQSKNYRSTKTMSITSASNIILTHCWVPETDIFQRCHPELECNQGIYCCLSAFHIILYT